MQVNKAQPQMAPAPGTPCMAASSCGSLPLHRDACLCKLHLQARLLHLQARLLHPACQA